MKIALCFRGISRSLTYTYPSIHENIVAPARALGEVRIFTHLFDQSHINNPRSHETGALDPSEHALLKSDWLQLEKPDDCLALHGFEDLKTFGDIWRDDFTSLRNLIHSLHSLKQGWLAARDWQPDVYLFLRPDLMYHDSFGKVLQPRFWRRPGLRVPLWQSWRGCNDRFAVATSARAAECYATRIDHTLTFCREKHKPLHSEEFLLWCVQRDRVPLGFLNVRASRVRSNGFQVQERFELRKKYNRAALKYGLRSQLRIFG